VATEEYFGEHLGSYQQLDFLTGKSPEELRDQLRQIKQPSKVIALYAVGGSHIAWVNLTRPIVKKTAEQGAQPKRTRGRPKKK